MARERRQAITSPALRPPARHPNFPLANGIRGLAAVAIVVVHVHVFTGGAGDDSLLGRMIIRLDVVLPIFFALSAFLLYRPLIAHRTGGPRAPGLGRFARGRFLRIYPLYWVVLTALAIFPGLAGVFGPDWWQFYSLYSSTEPGYSSAGCLGETFRCGLPQTWSLFAELGFYLLLPAYALLTDRMARGREAQAWVRNELLLLGGIALVLVTVSSLGMRNEELWRFSVFGNGFWFAIGLYLAVASVNGMAGRPFTPLRRLADRPGLSWGLAAAIYGALVLSLDAVPFIVARETVPEYLGSHLSFGLILLLALIPVAFGNPNLGGPRKLMARPSVLWLGALSYGIYLWHVTIAYNLGIGGGDGGFWIVLVMTFGLTIPLAAITYYLVELPVYTLVRHPIQQLRSVGGKVKRRLRPGVGGD